MPRTTTIRVEFSKEHDTYLAKYLARYCPSKEGRSGRTVFQRLVDNQQSRWPWSVHHTWQSWRERYVKNSGHFDALILKYQAKHNLKPAETRKRAAHPIPIEMLGPNAKRVKLEANEEEEEEEEGPSSEARTNQAVAAQHTSSSSKSTSKSTPKKHPREPDVRPFSPHRPSTSTNIDATEKPILDLTTHDTLEIPSSSPNKQASPLTDGKPEPPRPTTRLKKRSRVPSEVFASEPSSPRRDPVVVSVEGPSSQTRPVPDGAPVSTSTYPRAPPRIVDSLHGQVLIDQKGHVPCAIPRNCVKEEESEEEPKDKAQWPPPRGHTAKQRTASGPDVEVDTHHAFSQPQPLPLPPEESAAEGEQERGNPHHAFENVLRKFDGTLPDRRAVVAQFLGEVRHDVVPQVESERHEDAIRNGASPVKRIVPPAPDPLSGLVPKPSSKVLKFPAPRASTESPFRPKSPAGETPPPQPQPRPQSRTKAARHPALTRIRREIIENGKRNERERRREHEQVPSIDLVALSHSSMSARSHSRSSTGASVPARPSRWSLPAFTHATPWVLDEPHGTPSAPGSVLGSGSGSGLPFRWAPSPVYGDRARTSTPRFTFTPSPARSITAVATDGAGPRPNAFRTSPSLSLAPHPPDFSLTASHGLASILAHMSANHGLALDVVEAVYKRVGSLKEADEVLRGMREAAEGFGEREIERRVRKRKQGGGTGREGRSGPDREAREAALRYVVASEDGEGSEYSPPETSRAAMWKRQSESVGYAEEGGEEEEEEEGRAVEEELRERDTENDDEGLFVVHHDFSQHVPAQEEANNEVAGEDENRNDGVQSAPKSKEDAREEWTVEEALAEHIPAQELERKMGRGRFRKDIVKRFV